MKSKVQKFKEKKEKMRRRGRGGGIAAIRARQEARKQYQQTGELAEDGEQLSHVKEQMAVFKDKLEVFARRHRSAIRKDPEFRRQFQVMCARVEWIRWRPTRGFGQRFWALVDFIQSGEYPGRRRVHVDAERERWADRYALSAEQAAGAEGSNSVDVSVNDIEQAVGKLRRVW